MNAANHDRHAALDIGNRLTYLFEHVHPKDRGPYTNAEASAGSGVNLTTIKALRAGRQDNPTVHTLTSLARFFGVPSEVFVSEHGPEYILARQQLQAAALDPEVLRVAIRAGGLDADNLSFLAQVIDKARQAQGLNPASDHPDLNP